MKNLAKISFKTLRVVFGVFMIFIYFGMAALMYFNFFEWTASYTWFRYLPVVVFALYGVYRCYRQITGKDYYFLKNLEDKADMVDMADMADKLKSKNSCSIHDSNPKLHV